MNYELHKNKQRIYLGVEASFTLIDFLLFFSSFLLGFVFALFFFIFAVSVLNKLFSRTELEFDLDSYTIIKYYRFFGYFRIKLRTIGFGEVKEILFSNQESGETLFGRGMREKQWYTLDILTDNDYIRLAKGDEEEVEEMYELYEGMQEFMHLYFTFREQF